LENVEGPVIETRKGTQRHSELPTDKKEKKIRGNKSERISCDNSPNTIKTGEKQQDLRTKLEENSKKFSHLPVYDKTEERRKAEERRQEMTEIFSEMDKQLETVTGLTTSHMQEKGITMKPSTPFDEEGRAAGSPHSLHYKHSAGQSQGDDHSYTDHEPQTTQQTQHFALPPYKRKIAPDVKDEKETYESLGETFRQLRDKMETVTKDLKSDEIPYADDDDDNEDYPVDSQQVDEAIQEALSGFLDTEMSVERIQLEVDPSVCSTSLMVTERKYQGSDTVHFRRKTIRRDFTEI